MKLRGLINLKEKGAKIIGYGASAKFTQVTNMSEIDDDEYTTMDLSGNDNRGYLYSDYRIDFEKETSEPSKQETSLKIILEEEQGKPY